MIKTTRLQDILKDITKNKMKIRQVKNKQIKIIRIFKILMIPTLKVQGLDIMFLGKLWGKELLEK
jgi:hypothetical protein